jgi:hypothetical protein
MSLHGRLPLTGREKLKGSLVLALHATMVPLPGTMGGCLSTVCWNAPDQKRLRSKLDEILSPVFCILMLDSRELTQRRLPYS